jgi:uncharacterized phage-associated protein
VKGHFGEEKLTICNGVLKSILRERKQRKTEMVDVFDVAKYILHRQGPMTTMKLQKLVYYCQAWSLVWDEKPLFKEAIQAWASGPVVRDLYDEHRGKFIVPDISRGDIKNIQGKEKETIDTVLDAYGCKPGQWLADLTHMEQPWNDARKGCGPGDNCENEISLLSMAEYYSSMPPDSDSV